MSVGTPLPKSPVDVSPAGETTRSTRVLIVGAGPSGLGAAMRLSRSGIDDFIVIEKAAALGGTWRDNTYPGCACDIPSVLYSYSFAPNPSWSRTFASQREIVAYLDDTARRAGILERVRFGVKLLGARWDAEADRWDVDTSEGRFTAQLLVCASGPWHEPNIPALPGLDRFEGAVFHSARWDHDLDLGGKRVAVVGTGASAIQFVPKIQPRVERLHLFQRTPAWVLPKPDRAVSSAQKALFRRLPLAQEALRRLDFGLLELFSVGFRHPVLLRGLGRLALRHLRRSVPDPALRAALTPTFTLGCKRVLLSNTYYRSVAQPNVRLHPTAVAEVRPRSVVGADGTEAEVSAIIFGTGFQIFTRPTARHVYGAQGRSLADTWSGSPEAYLGTTVSGFPNLFLLLGPNLGTGHSSAFTVLEAQLDYMLDAIQTMTRRGLASIDVRPEVQAAYNAEIQAALQTTVYNAGGCSSYYIDENGRNSFAWPWSSRRMVRRVHDFDPASYASRPARTAEVRAGTENRPSRVSMSVPWLRAPSSSPRSSP